MNEQRHQILSCFSAVASWQPAPITLKDKPQTSFVVSVSVSSNKRQEFEELANSSPDRQDFLCCITNSRSNIPQSRLDEDRWPHTCFNKGRGYSKVCYMYNCEALKVLYSDSIQYWGFVLAWSDSTFDTLVSNSITLLI